MASLTETLATAKTNKPYTGYSGGGGAAGVAPMPNPYSGGVYGARLSYGPPAQDSGFYQQMLARTTAESAQPLPSTSYSAQYNFDPVLSRLTALRDMTIQKARDEAASAQKRALIESGDESLATSLAPGDPNTIAAAKANEFGTRQLLDRQYKDNLSQVDMAMNNANLYWGGARVDELAKQQFGMRQAETDWTTRFKDMYKGIGEALLGAEDAERQRMIGAQIARGVVPRLPVVTPPPPGPVVTPPVVDPNAGSFASAASTPVGMETPNAIYIPGGGFVSGAQVDPYESLAMAMAGRQMRT